MKDLRCLRTGMYDGNKTRLYGFFPSKFYLFRFLLCRDGMRKEEEGDDTISPNDYNILNPVNDPDLTYKEFLVRTNQVKNFIV